MADMFAPLEPYATGVLETGDGHQVYWEQCGNPAGRTAVFLHGGPGSGCSVNQRRLFDPSLYNVVLFDQRGCGRSRPLASDHRVTLSTNTTAHLTSDMESLRTLLAVESWIVVGLSWGTTLALAYAETYPQRVDGLLLGLVTTTSREEVQWITEDVGRIFPVQWDRFSSAVPEIWRHLPLVDAYGEMLNSDDAALRELAAREWCTWEDAHVSLAPARSWANELKRYDARGASRAN